MRERELLADHVQQTALGGLVGQALDRHDRAQAAVLADVHLDDQLVGVLGIDADACAAARLGHTASVLTRRRCAATRSSGSVIGCACSPASLTASGTRSHEPAGISTTSLPTSPSVTTTRPRVTATSRPSSPP